MAGFMEAEERRWFRIQGLDVRSRVWEAAQICVCAASSSSIAATVTAAIATNI